MPMDTTISPDPGALSKVSPMPASPPGARTPAADARGKLQVIISDEGFEAGRLNTVSIVVSNPFDMPVEILDIEVPKSFYLGGLTHGGAAKETVREIRSSDHSPPSTVTVTEGKQPVRGGWWREFRQALVSERIVWLFFVVLGHSRTM